MTEKVTFFSKKMMIVAFGVGGIIIFYSFFGNIPFQGDIVKSSPGSASSLGSAPTDLKYIPGVSPSGEYKALVEQWQKQSRVEEEKIGKTTVSFIPDKTEEIPNIQPNAQPSESTPAVSAEQTINLQPVGYANDNTDAKFEPVGVNSNSDTNVRATEVSLKLEELKKLAEKHYAPIEGHKQYEVADASPQVNLTSATAKPRIGLGEVFLCKMDHTVDSRIPSPAMATCVSGALKGVKVKGTFAQRDDKLVFPFTTMYVNDKTVPIDAIAIDYDNRAGLATHVDRQTFLRTAALVGSEFLAAFKDIHFLKGKVNITPQAVTVERTFDTRDKLEAGVGKVGDRLAQRAEKFYDTPPIVVISAGEGFGLLFLGAVAFND